MSRIDSSVAQLRQFIIESLRDAGALSRLSTAQVERFFSGVDDVSISLLRLDSLERMDLLVAIELELDTVISPVQFGLFKTLGDLATHLATARNCSAGVSAPVAASPDFLPAPRLVDVPRIVRVFRRGFRYCKTVAQLNKMLSSFEHRAMPREMFTLDDYHARGVLISAADDKFTHATREWLDRMLGFMRRSGKCVPEPYEMLHVLPSLGHITGPGDRAAKTLLLCFAMMGSRRMMIPHAALLQHLDARKYDLLVVADPANTGFRGRVPLLGESVDETISSLSRLPMLSEYKVIRTFGCSAGSYPAILAGFRLSADAAIAIGGRFPSERHLPEVLGMMWRTWRAARRSQVTGDTTMPVLVAYSRRKSRDRAYAARVNRLAQASELAIEVAHCEIGHLVMVSLLMRGRLDQFLERTVLFPENQRSYQPRSITVWRVPDTQKTDSGFTSNH